MKTQQVRYVPWDTERTADKVHFNFKWLMSHTQYPTKLVIGLKGIGKTWPCKCLCVRRGLRSRKFLWLRDIESVVDKMQSQPEQFFSDIVSEFPGHAFGLAGGVFTADGEQIGALESLSTFYKQKGMDYSQFDTIVFDEFIPERVQARQKDPFLKFANVIKQVGRLRKKFDVICTANALDRGNPLLIELGFNIKDYGVYYNPKRGAMCVYAPDSPAFRKAQSESLAGKLFEGTSVAYNLNEGAFQGDVENIYERKGQTYMAWIVKTEEGAFAIEEGKDGDTIYISYAPPNGSYTARRYTDSATLQDVQYKYEPKLKTAVKNLITGRKILYQSTAVRDLFEWWGV